MTNQRDQIVTGVMTVLLTAAFAALLFVPHERHMRSLNAGIAALRAEAQRRAVQTRDLKGMQEEIRRLETGLNVFDQAVPNGGDLGGFLEQVADAARQQTGAGGRLDPEVTPLETSAAAYHPPGLSDDVVVLPVRMSLSGGFESVHGFLGSLRSMPRLARVSRLEVERNSNGLGPDRTTSRVIDPTLPGAQADAAPLASGTVEAEVTVQIFYRRPASRESGDDQRGG